MFRNFLTVAIRNLKRQFTYSVINILGLAVGMACSLVIFLYVYGELTYDRHYENADRIYRAGVSFFNIGQFANGPEQLKDKLQTEFAGIEAITHFQRNPQESLEVNGETFKEQVFYVDSSFFRVFSHNFISGSERIPFSNSKSIIITESIAEKFFKGENPVGKIIEVGKSKEPFAVSAIVKDQIANSHLKAKVWIPLDERNVSGKYWTSAAVYNYVLLRQNSTVADLRAALDKIIEKYVYPDSGSPKAKISLEDYIKDENSVKFFIHPLKDIYLKSKVSLELSPGGNETNIMIFGVVAMFILLLAAVNFINLSTARATRRAKEVGVRKSLGTSKARLVFQFLVESVLICLLSLVIALCLAELFTFIFYWVTGQQLSIRIWSSPISILLVIGFSILVGLLSGLYPALYLTQFQPVKVLKGNVYTGRSSTFRNSLVVFQFTISIALIVASIVIIRQLNYMSTKDLGFKQDNILTIDNISELKSKAIDWRDHLLQQPGVENASLHGGEPGNKSILSFYTYRTDEMTNDLTINTYIADANFVDLMGFKILQGRNFNADLTSDTASVILNEAAVRALNLGENPIGTVVNKTQKIIGVVADFHWESLRNNIAPMAIVMPDEKKSTYASYQLSVTIKSNAATEVISMMEGEWKERVPDEPFAYHFMDENFGAIVKKEQVMAKAIGFFTVLAIVISCLGLFGLSAYITDQRTKEIGIRKVLGATMPGIVIMLNKQFTLLVIIAMFIAIPASYYVADWWLSGFAYRTTINPVIFIFGGVVALIISYLTVAFHSVKAAQTNPVETLKCE
jgi:putative ABC transport system permease protein